MRILYLITAMVLLAAGTLPASEYRAQETVHIIEGDTLSNNLFATGNRIDVEGVVKGSLFSAGERSEMQGRVMGNMFSGSRDVMVRGTVEGLVAVAGENITIDGVVLDDVLAFGGRVIVTERADIRGNLFAGTGNIILEEGSRVGGNLRGGAGWATLNGSIAGEVEFQADFIAFGDDFAASGPVALKLHKRWMEREIENLPDNATIAYTETERFFLSGFFYWSLLSMFVLGIIYLLLFKNASRDQLVYAKENPGMSLLSGLGVLVGIPVAVVILAVMVITIPVALILLLLYGIAVYVSTIFASLYVGRLILARNNGLRSAGSYIGALALGLLIIFLVTEIPFLGGLIQLAVICFGLGGFVSYLWYHYKSNREQAAGA